MTLKHAAQVLLGEAIAPLGQTVAAATRPTRTMKTLSNETPIFHIIGSTASDPSGPTGAPPAPPGGPRSGRCFHRMTLIKGLVRLGEMAPRRLEPVDQARALMSPPTACHPHLNSSLNFSTMDPLAPGARAAGGSCTAQERRRIAWIPAPGG